MAASGGRLIPLGRPDQNLRGGRVFVSVDRNQKRTSNVDLLLAPSSCVVVEPSKASSVECPSSVIWRSQIEDTPEVGTDNDKYKFRRIEREERGDVPSTTLEFSTSL